AALRCVGIGKCRHTHGGVMCPSYMVTREEKHTTRGRARMLWEMVNGQELELWRSEEVLEALDLCLSCKGCTKDCPVSVDMPTLKAEFLSHNPAGKKVILWADTFTNHFHTDVGVAAVEALEDAGCNVVIPQGHLCCGRPLYDYGMLDLAARYIERVLDALRHEIRAGTPVVGAEPSCVAVFKDELLKLRPNDEDAKRLAHQTHHLAEFLAEEGYKPPPLERKVVLHEHCHQHATGGADPDQKLLEAMGVEVEKLDSGCCGMAG